MMNAEVTKWLDFFVQKAEELGWGIEQYGVVGDFPLIALVKFGKNPDEAPIYLSSGMHGDEPAGPMALLESFMDGTFSDDQNWLLVPMLNPCGMSLQTRENGEGLDINRDYQKFRTYEAKSHAEWFARQRVPKLALSLHEDWETTGYYFYEINQAGGEPEKTHKLIEIMNDIMPCEPMLEIDGHEVRELGWIYHEAEADEINLWPEAIYLAKKGVPVSFTVETPSSLDIRERIDLQKGFIKESVTIFGNPVVDSYKPSL